MEKFVQVSLLIGGIFIELFWIITDPRPLKERIGQSLTLRSILYTVSILSVILISIYSLDKFKWFSTSFDNLIIIFGLFIFFTGLVIATWAKITMKRSWGLPAQLNIKRQKNLIIQGPFAFSRNPIYLGLILMCFGYFISLRSYLIFSGIILFWYFNKAIKKEESLLEKNFGKKYTLYKSKVPRFF